jgi:PQQ-dependent dehydrogenase (methanol/ethanol family)
MTRMTWKITASTIGLAVGCGASGAAFANDDVLARQNTDVVQPSITYNGWNLSPFDQIDRGNVDQLQLQWAFQLGALDEYEAPPLVVGNVMYIVHPVDAPEEVPNFVTAHDLTDNGRILWEFRPDIPDVEAARQACCGDQTRGMQYAEGKIFMHTLDGQVFALDAETGEPLWRTTGADASIREHTAGNGLIAGDLYIIGNAGGEYGVRGKVQAFNIDSGNLQWVMFSMGPNNEVGVGPRFDPQYEYMQGANPALDTWFGDSWRHGGGTSWGYFTFDPDRNMFFYGTGNCGPWNPDYRREWGVLDLDENGGLATFQNNWCAATMARDATTGELIWAYANTPGDPWDLDVPLIHPLIEYEGQDAVVLAARNGWMYVWDRDNGRILNVPWMHTFVDITMGVNLETGLPIYVPDNWSFTDLEDRRRYTDADPMGGGRIDAEDYTGTEIEVCPGTSARNWQNDVYNPNLGLLYTVNNTSCSTWRFIEGEYEAGAGYTLLDFNAGPSPERWFGNGVEVGQTFYNYQDLVNAPVTEITNQLMANDPHNGVQVWTVDYFQGNDSPPFGTITDLIFKGGKHDGAFHAYDAATGEELWKFSLGTGFEGTAISYMGDDGRQYIAVIGSSSGTSNVDAGDGPNADERWRRGGSTLYVFALPTSVAGN